MISLGMSYNDIVEGIKIYDQKQMEKFGGVIAGGGHGGGRRDRMWK
ncbi:MAG: hypothetical protein NC416_09745 [Eubacterium sp.]|nr:hypothetical protein [Eubacterium sp.]